MSLAFALRHRRRLLMQFDPHKGIQAASFSSTPSTSNPDLKRPYGSTAVHQQHKVPRLDNPSRGYKSDMPPPTSNWSRGGRGAGGSRTTASHASRSSAGRKGGHFKSIIHEGPIHSFDWITENDKKAGRIDRNHESSPKALITEFLLGSVGAKPQFTGTEGYVHNADGSQTKIWRTKVVIPSATPGAPPIAIGVGDHEVKKDSERLASLSAVYQLYAQDLVKNMQKAKSSNQQKGTKSEADTIQLSDGSTIGYEQCRAFMDYYCRRYNFGRPDVTVVEVKNRKVSTWEASITVGGRRIGMGSSVGKKGAQTACFLDVTKYLEGCDPELWQAYLVAAKSGAALGMAPKVWFQMQDGLDEEIRDLCHDIKNSSLYKNRPSAGHAKMGEAEEAAPAQTAARFGSGLSTSLFTDKSARLKKQREDYLVDPQLEKMRAQRMGLPVYTRADDVMKHIQDHDVTILMAATGSGKTTQIPQLILDEWIDNGNGAACNVVCTQPRRIAAISVADRVSKERGEVVGRGSIGYQVRFEAKLPEEHGSVTFCTTGIFLKRVQSSLSGTSGRNRSLDDVTHIVVDEVHERDVDTDLLLVVLKRLLAVRKAAGKPLKIILMSATIDPTLFQTYFADEKGVPATVTEIPGRSFPVTKSFLEDYVPDLIKSRVAPWVFSNDTVIKYLNREMGTDALLKLGIQNRNLKPEEAAGSFEHEGKVPDDVDMPHPLLALTIAHVMKKTEDGHVLVFLPGWDDIINLQKNLMNPQGPLMDLNFNDQTQYTVHLLHSTVPLAEQQLIFEPPPKGVRRIILATNIAETSITIPDVVYVVDSAKTKEQRYDPDRHMSSLISAWVGKSNLNQRAGRAGRHRAGEYFGILGRAHADRLDPYQTVEMKRVDLSNVVMHVKALDFPGVTVEEVLESAIEPPAKDRVIAAMKNLMMVGALDSRNNLTFLGRVLLQLPVEAQMGRLVLFGSFFRCLDQALTLAAILTNRDPFVSPMHLKVEAAARKASWTPVEFRSDALATLKAYNAWWAIQSRGDYNSANRFCIDNFLSKPTLLMIQKIKGHLLTSMSHAGIIDVSAGGGASVSARGERTTVPPELNTNGDSLPLLAALISVASQPKFAIKTGDNTLRTPQDKAVMIHPSSVNHRRKDKKDNNEDAAGEKELFAFQEKRQSAGSGQMFLVTTTRLDPMTYILFGAHNIEVTDQGLNCDGWLPVVGNIDALDDVQRLKTLMESCMLRVFEGIIMSRRHNHHRNNLPILPREEAEVDEDGDDVDPSKDYSMSATEIKELDLLTRDIVRVLNRYSEQRIASQSRSTSRAGTPYGSPSTFPSRLPGGSGYSTPYGASTPYGGNSAYNSRPGTPSRLGQQLQLPSQSAGANSQFWRRTGA